MADLELTNIINVSVSAAQTGIGDYNTSNIALFTRSTPGMGFGSLGYKIYLDPTGVGTDFGTSDITFLMANAAFSQKPNFLAGNGYLVVIPLLASNPAVTAVQHIAFPTVPATGTWKLGHNSDITGALSATINAATLQSDLRAFTGFSSITVTGDTTAGFTITFTGVTGPVTNLVLSANSLQDSTPIDVVPVITTTVVGVPAGGPETIAAAVTRTKDLVQYFGILAAEISNQTDLLAAAAVVQPLNKIAFWPQLDPATVAPGGTLDLLRSGDFSQNRGLFYENASVANDTLVMGASYAGRALSTNFSGSNTTQTMHLKDLIGVQPDSAMTQTLLTQCQSAGADVYASFQGVAKTFTSGANDFFDQVYNLQWFVGAIQVAGFNALAESSTKLPQTEDGVAVLKGAYRAICEEAVTNQYVAPGTWNSSTTFGNQADFLRNVSERGYYIFSQPVSQQSQTDRAARKAPIIQIAVKEAGAIHSSSVIIYVNA